MNIWLLALQEIRIGLRNRLVIATTVVLGALALSLVLLGSAPTGSVKVDAMAVVVVSLASLTIFLVPLIALLLSFDTIVGEHERGTLMLLLSYPIARWQVIVGKIIGQSAILAIATIIGYGVAGAALWFQGDFSLRSVDSFTYLVLTSIMLGAAFISIGCLASTLVRERATAAGLAVGVWLFFVLIYDTAVLGILVADQGQHIGQAALDILLLLNPTDAFRIFNMMATESVSVYSGMAGPGDASVLPGYAFLIALAGWIIIPLILAILIFKRRSI